MQILEPLKTDSLVAHRRRDRKWSEEYEERINANHERSRQEKERHVAMFTGTVAGAILARRFASKLRKRLQAKVAASKMIIPTKKTLENMKQPDLMMNYANHWNFCSTCDLCEQPAVTDIKFCKYCDNGWSLSLYFMRHCYHDLPHFSRT